MSDLDTLLAAAKDGRLATLISVARAGGARRIECGALRLELGPAETTDAEPKRGEPLTWSKDELFGASAWEPQES